nr:hypothetical protein [Tanacetum cinerariifolium]
MSKQCTKPKRKRDDAWFKNKVLLVQAQANGQILHELQKVSSLMANLSHYGSDALAEVHNPDNMDNNMINQGVQKAQQLKPKLYDGNVIKNTYAIVIPDSEETLMLAEKSHSKMLLKQQDLMVLEKKVNTRPVDYANSMNSSDLSPSCTPTRVKDNSISNQSAPNFDQYFELNEMKAQSQEKDMVITKLNERIKSFSGNINKDKVKKDIDKIEMINIEHVFDQENSEQGLIIAALKDDLKNLKGKL